MADSRGVFRVNTYDGGKPISYLVCALTDVEAVGFVGAQDVSGTSAVRVLYPVEVAGLDTPHDHIAPAEIFKAPFDLPKSISRQEFDALQAQLANLQTQLNAKNTPAAPQPK
jgi:hypothetical protein